MIICLTLFTKNLYFMNSLYRFTINQNKMKTRVKKHTLQFCFIILIFNYIFCAADLHQKYTFTKKLTYCISRINQNVVGYGSERIWYNQFIWYRNVYLLQKLIQRYIMLLLQWLQLIWYLSIFHYFFKENSEKWPWNFLL